MKTKQEKRQRRKYHVRNRLMRDGAPARLTVSRSSKHIYAQIVDSVGRTLCGTGMPTSICNRQALSLVFWLT